MAAPGRSAPATAARRPSAAAALLILGLAIFAGYGNSLAGEFVFDDHFVVPDCRSPAATADDWYRGLGVGGEGRYRPLRHLSYLVDCSLAGHRPVTYHVSNLLHHWLCAYLLFLTVSRLSAEVPLNARGPSRQRTMAPARGHRLGLATALLWALHPIQTEAVAYVSGRRDLLAGLCFLLGCYGYLRFRQDSRARTGWLAVVWLAFVAGALSKEVVLVLPLALLIIDLFAVDGGMPASGSRPVNWRPHWRLHLSMLAVSALGLGLYLPHLQGLLVWHGTGPLATWATVPRIWLLYLKQLLLPIRLRADYSGGIRISSSWLDPAALLAAIAVGLLGTAAILAYRRGLRLVPFCGAWFLVTLLPVSQLLPHPELAAERFLYLPSVGFCLALALLLVPAAGSKRAVRSFVLAALLAGYGARTVIRNQDWRYEEEFWRRTARETPYSARAHHNLAVVLIRKGAVPEAIVAFESALRADPDYGYSRTGLAEAHLRLGRPCEALTFARQGVELRPRWPRAHFILAVAHSRLHQTEAAVAALRETVRLRPDYLAAHPVLGEYLDGLPQPP